MAYILHTHPRTSKPIVTVETSSEQAVSGGASYQCQPDPKVLDEDAGERASQDHTAECKSIGRINEPWTLLSTTSKCVLTIVGYN